MILAFDPGRNLGMALVSPEGRLVDRAILAMAELATLDWSRATVVVVGDGTGSAQLQERLRSLGVAFVVADERDTSLEARRLYFEAHPASGLQRLLPLGLRAPPRPIDDFAAYAIALRFLERSRKS